MPEGRRETRIIRCPSCQRYYRMTAGAPLPGTRLRCTKCGEIFALDAAGATPPATAAAPAAAPAPGPAPAAAAGRGRVLVATDGQEFQALIGEVLEAEGFELSRTSSGEATWAAIGSWRPHVALLDVALPGVPAFEICDRVRANAALGQTGLILIASVFQQTRYKRAPTSLYGADDYIEKHHIRDRLPGKVARLLPAAAPSPSAATAPVAEVARTPAVAPPHGFIGDREKETLIREELYGSRGPQHQGLERLRENLRRYARIIVSDIALYNQELVERGIREGTFTQLLGSELDEGRRLYLTRVPPGSTGAAFYEEAVRDFIHRRTAGRGGAAHRGRSGHGRS